MTHSTHFIYGYMASDTQIAREETCCHHYIGYSFQLAASIEININNNNIPVVNILLVLTEAGRKYFI